MSTLYNYCERLFLFFFCPSQVFSYRKCYHFIHLGNVVYSSPLSNSDSLLSDSLFETPKAQEGTIFSFPICERIAWLWHNLFIHLCSKINEICYNVLKLIILGGDYVCFVFCFLFSSTHVLRNPVYRIQ